MISVSSHDYEMLHQSNLSITSILFAGKIIKEKLKNSIYLTLVRKLSDNKNQKLQCNICPFFCFLFSFFLFSFVCSLLTTRKVVVTLSFLVNLIEVILSEVILHCCYRAHF